MRPDQGDLRGVNMLVPVNRLGLRPVREEVGRDENRHRQEGHAHQRNDAVPLHSGGFGRRSRRL
jgi:hypothetical protein